MERQTSIFFKERRNWNLHMHPLLFSESLPPSQDANFSLGKWDCVGFSAGTASFVAEVFTVVVQVSFDWAPEQCHSLISAGVGASGGLTLRTIALSHAVKQTKGS
jgi:hypothetical protein